MRPTAPIHPNLGGMFWIRYESGKVKSGWPSIRENPNLFIGNRLSSKRTLPQRNFTCRLFTSIFEVESLLCFASKPWFSFCFFFPSDLIWESFLALFGILFHSLLLFFFAHRDELIYLQLKIYENVDTSPAIRMFGTWFYDIFEIRQKLSSPDLGLDLNKSFSLSI